MQQPTYLAPTTRLSGRYVIASHLGGGGFGQTYLAEDRQLPGHPQCVVKQFKPQLTAPKALQIARRLFDTEAEVLYKLGNHPQIPRILAHFEENEEFFLVQEFIEGHDLEKELVPGKKLSEAQVTSIVLEILEILSFVHQEHVIHRDIKPTNIIRRKRDSKLVLIDFGAVKQISVDSAIAQKHTTLTIAIGTPGYMPNEQSIGKPRFCSDVYAVGVIGIQALTGLTPDQFAEDPTTGEISWRQHAQASLKLMEILDKMVRYDFRQRYQSALEVLQDFQVQGAVLPGSGSSPNIPSTIIPSVPSTIISSSSVPSTIISSNVSASSSQNVSQSDRSLEPREPARKLGDVQKILLLGGLVGGSIIAGFMIIRTPQIAGQRSSQDLQQASPSPSIANSVSPTPEASAAPPTSSPSPVEAQPAPPESPIASPVPSSPVPASQGWKYLGSAATGEKIYVDSGSIAKSADGTRFTYKIGDEVISARADCSKNGWYADSYGWYSPQSEATQSMLNYVCSF